jgi:hypothetical protein
MAGFLDGLQRGFAAGRAGAGKPEGRGHEATRGADGGDDRQILAETTALAEQLNARVAELEAELAAAPAAAFATVLLLPGVKRWLITRFHPDKPGLNDAERAALTEAMQKINVAYEQLEKKGDRS